MPRSASVALVALGLSLGAVAGAVLAEPLAKEECDKLQAEQNVLTTAGVRDHLGRGAEWGKANLSPPQLEQIARFIVLEEQLSFRCGLAKLRASLPVAEEGGDQDLDENGIPLPAKGKPAAKAPLAKDKAPAAAPPAAGKKANAQPGPVKGEAQPAAAKAAPKPKPKAKVDDAYRPPPPKAAASDPFAAAGPAQNK
jgi:hypothetical protein